ncbi:MAG: N-acetyltransferase [Oscillospiraceae bacterium]|nr:N-acetyltransferase [Oscillospiraceae bacterium]
MIRIATMHDLVRAREIIGIGRAAMRAAGNTVQWAPVGQAEEAVAEDIRQGRFYVLEDDGGIYGVFALVLGDDPTYEYIEGAWRRDAPYGTIHRIASDGTHRGVLAECVRWSMEQIPHLRIDTHQSNRAMRGAIEKLGFVYCGTIYIADGTPRMAYDLM